MIQYHTSCINQVEQRQTNKRVPKANKQMFTVSKCSTFADLRSAALGSNFCITINSLMAYLNYDYDAETRTRVKHLHKLDMWTEQLLIKSGPTKLQNPR